MPGSLTTPGRPSTRINALARIAFRFQHGVGTQDRITFAAQWLACTLPYRRFAPAFTGGNARLGVDAGCYSFIVSDFHQLLLAGLPAHVGVIS